MNTILKIKAIGLLLILSGIAAAAALHAGRDPQPAADAALGSRDVYAHIRQAADAVCGPHVEDVTREARRSVCMRHAIASGVAAEGSRSLSHYEAAKSGGRALLNDGLAATR